MAQYGEVRVDFITYTTGVSPEANATITVSSLVNSPTFSGDVVVQGNAEIEGNASISGDLLVSGNSVIEGNNTVSGITITSGMIVQNDATVSGDLTVNGELIATGLVGYVKLNDGGTQQDITGGGGLSIDGNVGIGTDDPQGELDVFNSTQVSAYFGRTSDSVLIEGKSATSNIQFGNNRTGQTLGNRILQFNRSSGKFQFLSGNNGSETDQITILPGGDVGIGTNDPQVKLHVSENGADASITLSAVQSTAPGQSEATFVKEVGPASGAVSGDSAFNIISSNGSLGSPIVFHSRGTFNADSEKMRIDAFGNVGIGTDAPTQKLEVESNSGTVARLTSTTDQSLLRFGSSEGNNLYIGIAGVNAFVVRNKLATGSVNEKFRVTGDGNVGINTSSPLHRLDVVGDLMVRTPSNDGSGTTRQIYFGKSANPKAALQVINTGSNGRCDLAFLLNNDNTATTVAPADHVMRITRTGRVGIGVNNPLTKLDVGGGTLGETAGDSITTLSVNVRTTNLDAINFISERETNGNTWPTVFHKIQRKVDGTLMGYMAFGGIGGSDTPSNPMLSFGKGTNQYVNIRDGGRVGINNTDPQEKLDVNGTIRAGSRILENSSDNTSSRSRAITWTFENQIGCRIIGQRPAGGDETDAFMQIATGSQTGLNQCVATFTADQKVAINKLTPNATLDVNGDIRTTALNVSSGNIALSSTTSSNAITVQTNVNNGNEPKLLFEKSRGGSGTIAPVQNNDRTGKIEWRAYFDGSYQAIADITCRSLINSGAVEGSVSYTADRHAFAGPVNINDGLVFGNAVAPVTSKTLEDYEEGTFTPTVIGNTTAGSVTYGMRFGFYTKIGNVVTINMRVQWNSGVGGAGGLRITGLPYNNFNQATFGIGWIPIMTEVSTISSDTTPCLFLGANVNTIQCRQFNSSTTSPAGSTIAWAAEGNIITTFSYRSN